MVVRPIDTSTFRGSDLPIHVSSIKTLLSRASQVCGGKKERDSSFQENKGYFGT